MILDLQSDKADIARAAGGKGGNLWCLAKDGVPVPPFFVIGAPAFEQFVDHHRIDLAQNDVADRIRGQALPHALKDSVANAYKTLGAKRVAVRSSALAEDSVAHSFAGQLQTFLHLETLEQVLEAVVNCYASAFSDHAVAYMQKNQLAPKDARVAVVVQEMVDAESAGVTFTADPVSGGRDRMVVSSVWGLGEGLVSGQLDADTFRLGKDGAVVEEELSPKPTQLVHKSGGGIEEVAVPEEHQKVASLRREDLRALYKSARHIEDLFDRPQDIEWAFAGGTLYVLQARPITTLSGSPKPVQIWDNSNIVESYAGITSPLTFSFARDAYYHVYVQFCEVMGVPEEDIISRDHVMKNMLGYLDGRIYYNLLNWYNLVGLFPGFNQNKQFMEGMMGVRSALPADAQDLLVLPGKATFKQRLQRIGLSLRMLGRFFNLKKTVSRFRAHFEDKYDGYYKTKFRGRTAEDLIAIYRDMRDDFLKHWKAPIINDFFAMVTFGMLRKWTTSWEVDEAGTLQNDLLCGEGGVESAVPTELLMKLAERIREHEGWKKAFEEESLDELRTRVEADADYGELKVAITDYLDRFGFRCMNELKLEEPDLHTDPTFVYQSLKNYIIGNPPSVAEMREREQRIRREAEDKARKKLSGLRRRIYFWILGHARETVKNRENLRLARTRVFGLIRRLFDAVGHDLVLRGQLDSDRDVYYLRVEELEALVDGCSTTLDLRGLAALRRKEQEGFAEREPDERFVTRGLVYLGNDFKSPAAPPNEDGVFRGIGCCPGRVTARAKVVHDPKSDMQLDGQILVATRTDPGWTPLFPSASGILVERGSLLSHSAIVARELGIPCVVGIRDLMSRVTPDEMIEMDGSEGWARPLAETKETSGEQDADTPDDREQEIPTGLVEDQEQKRPQEGHEIRRT